MQILQPINELELKYSACISILPFKFMRLTQYFVPTLKDDPVDAVVASHRLMIRSGMIRPLTSGVYSYLPLGLKMFRKVEEIIRQEMNAIGGNEFYLPVLSPNDLWAQTGRLEDYGDLMFRIKNRELVLAPTHEEVFTSIAKPNLISYKDLPKIWYQIQSKFRNEERPRAGVLRGRQFTMKDAYSFDSTWEGLDKSYDAMAIAYRNIFNRCGLNFVIVSAHSGAMGGSASEEFMVPSPVGEDNIVFSEDGKYSSNIEVAVSFKEGVKRIVSDLPLEEFHTPNIKSIDELAGFLGIEDKSRLAKSRVFVNPGKEKNEFIMVLVCGDDEVNESKLQNHFGLNIRPAHSEELAEITGADAGSIGPIDARSKGIKVIADLLLKDANELISGANKNDYHIKNIDLIRDVPDVEYLDLRVVKEGEHTIDSSSVIRVTRAIEVGHIFKLGTKFSEALNATFLDAEGKENVIIMGSYGIGVERTVAAYIEQNNDEKGIIWSGEMKPFDLVLISLNQSEGSVKQQAEMLYSELLSKGIDVLFDDRPDVRPGVKFNDSDLIGIPLQAIVGEKNLAQGNIELKIRKTGERILVNKDDALNKIIELAGT